MALIDLSSIDLNLLVAFEVLFEERSVTASAQRLYLGQPAMSAALGRLRRATPTKLPPVSQSPYSRSDKR